MNILCLLEYEEGYRERPYLCSNGYPTIGIGQRLGPKCTPDELVERYQFTVSPDVASAWCSDHVTEVIARMRENQEISAALIACNEPRRAVLTSMAYQMGVAGLDNFKNTLKAIQEKNWRLAADEMMNSKWARYDSPKRAARHSAQMLLGAWIDDYC